jgi:hypothetical protein
MRNAEHQSFDFSKVLVLSREIDRKSIPRLSMLILAVRLEAPLERRSEADIVEPLLPVERIDTGISSDQITDDIAMIF